MLETFGAGLGSIAVGALLGREAGARERSQAESSSAFGPGPHLTPRAKNVIWIFLRGGLSHLESFDPKPTLDQYAGKAIPDTPFRSVQDPKLLKRVRVVVVNDANGQQRNKLYGTQVGFRRYGESGIPVSDWFPHIGGVIDDIAVVRSMWTTDDNHGAQIEFHSGRHMLDGRFPTIGAWATWGLGTLNENLPQFITMGPRFFDRRDGHYLGPAYDAVPIRVDPKNPLPYATPELDLSRPEQAAEFELIAKLGRHSARRHPGDAELEARIRSYELAFRMQSSVPAVMDFDRESAETRRLYGFDRDVTRPFAQQLLAARRFVEQGVRFVQILHGDGAAGAWDAHSNLQGNHRRLSAQVDRPIAGLIRDLKQRGLLKETIVVIGDGVRTHAGLPERERPRPPPLRLLRLPRRRRDPRRRRARRDGRDRLPRGGAPSLRHRRARDGPRAARPRLPPTPGSEPQAARDGARRADRRDRRLSRRLLSSRRAW